jgi:hypothetical protein
LDEVLGSLSSPISFIPLRPPWISTNLIFLPSLA